MAISLNGTTGITTPGITNTGAETVVDLTTTGNTILGDASGDTLTVTGGTTTFTQGTANGVAFLNGSKVLTTGSANLTFNGTTLTANTIGAFTLGGTIAGGGNQINNVIIGTTTPLAGSFTTLSATLAGGGSPLSISSGSFCGFSITGAGSDQFISFNDGATARAVMGVDFSNANAFVINSGGGSFGTQFVLNTSGNLSLGGTLGVTGTLSGGTSGTGYSFSGSAPAGSLTLNSGAALSVSGVSGTGYQGFRLFGTGTAYNYMQIDNTGGTADFGIENSSGGALISGSSAYATVIQSYSNTAIHFGTNNTLRMTLDTSGNLGIGNTTASSFTLNAASNLVVGTGSASAGITIYSGTTNQGAISFADGSAASDVQYRGFVNYSHSLDALLFGAAAAERVRISSDGTFRVKGAGTGGSTDAVQFSGSAPANSLALNSSGQLGIGISATTALTVGTGGALRLYRTDNAIYTDIYNTTGASGGFVLNNANGDGFSFQNSANTAMRLDSSGNLLVGTTSSSAIANKNIDVNGTGDAAFVVRVGGTTTSYLYSTAGQTILGTVGALPITFNPNGTERARIDASGNVVLGSSANGGQAMTTLQGYTPNSTNGSYGNLLFSANTNYTGGAKRYLLTNALDYTNFAIICSADATTTPTLDSGGAVSSGTAAFVIKTNATAIFNSVVSVGAATPSSSGAGITFPATQSASSDANTLDDYEEGTFTPTATGVTVNSGTPVWSSTYTKVGRTVVFTWQLTGGANVTIPVLSYLSLPFSSTDVAWGSYGNNSSSAFIGGLQSGGSVVYFGTASTLVSGGGTIVYQV